MIKSDTKISLLIYFFAVFVGTDMGCTSSILANNTTLPISTQAFTQQQKHLVLKTWSILNGDMKGRGTRIFLRIFQLNPDVKRLFPCRHLDGAELVQDSVFKGHAMRFMEYIGAVVDNIDHYEEALSPLLRSLGRQHIFYSGFRYHYFDAFEEAMMHVWAEDLGSLFTDDARMAWHHIFSFVIIELKQGFSDALKEAGLQRPPWEDQTPQKHDARTNGTSASAEPLA